MIELSLTDFNYYSGLIYSCMSQPEQEDPNSQSTLKYALKKWQKNALKLADKITSEAKEELQDKFEALDVKYGLKDKETGVLIKKDNHVQYKAEDEIKVSKEKRKIQKELNEKTGAKTIKFEPYFFEDADRIAKIDPFTREELAGIFIKGTNALNVTIPDSVDSLSH